MWLIGKNISYSLTEKSLLFQQNLNNEAEMSFLDRYLYLSGRGKGGYKDVSLTFDKMKSINKNNKGNFVLVTSSLLVGEIIISREIGNLRDLENQIKAKLK